MDVILHNNRDDTIIKGVRKIAENNWKIGKEYNSTRESRTVNWWKEDGWTETVGPKLEKIGYCIMNDQDCNNVLIEWKAPKTTPP